MKHLLPLHCFPHEISVFALYFFFFFFKDKVFLYAFTDEVSPQTSYICTSLLQYAYDEVSYSGYS